MNKILFTLCIGLFAIGANAIEAPKAETTAPKAHHVKHTAAPAKKAKLHKEEAKKDTTHAANVSHK